MAQAVAYDDRKPGLLRGLVQRQLPHYPENGPRTFYLGVVVLATIVLYYELYVGGAVATQVAADLHMSLKFLIGVSIAGNAVGAFASLAAGLADRWGRSNLVAFGLLGTGLLVLFALPHSSSKGMFMFFTALVGLVEGMALVATPALIRDFSPQLGRASAMGFWTLGPVIGSLVVTEVSSHTLGAHPDWRFQYYVAGIAGLVVWAIAMVGLRELSPQLRDQLMVSLRDRALVEARAAGIDPDAAVQHGWRQMLSPSIVGPAFAISIFLLFYYIMVGFLVVYFATNYGYTPDKANALGNWYWIANAIALVITGVLSDRLRVRKPFMLVGGLISAGALAYFATLATHHDTSYSTFSWLFVIMAAGGGIAYCAWMAAYTESVEKKNPAATAHGLAVWGWTIRMVVVVSLVAFMFVVTAASTLVDQGAKVQELATKYSSQLATFAKVDKATLAALAANPADQAAGVKAVSEISGVPAADVVKVATIEAKYPQQVETLSAIDPQTAQALFLNSSDQAAQAKAVGEISSKLQVTQAEAITRLVAAGQVPKADLVELGTYGTKVAAGAAALKATATIPKADLAYLQKYGDKVTKAAKDSPKQWQNWWWVCFAGQILFLPFIFLLTGRWSPRRAREDAVAHEAAVQREMAALGVAGDYPTGGATTTTEVRRT